MKTTFLFAAAAAVVPFCASTALAGDFTGGSIGLGYSAFTNDDAGTIDKTSLGGSIEYGFDRNVSVQGDLTLSKFGLTDADAQNVTLHGIFHLDEATSFGAFIGHDEVESLGLTFYGLEAGHEVGQFEGETYIAYGEDDGVDGTLFGLSGLYNVNDAFGFGASYDRLDVESVALNRVALEAEYRMQNVILSAELGQLDAEDAGSETFFGIGARLSFGAKRGTTFERRGLIDTLPGL